VVVTSTEKYLSEAAYDGKIDHKGNYEGARSIHQHIEISFSHLSHVSGRHSEALFS